MNRTVAQAASVLRVDGSLVKHWALLFKDYLSYKANPAKGKARRFTDGDLLVLLYVRSEWEDNPDMEAIRVGLNLENHHEDCFREHLHWHTPLLQEPPEELDETWRHGILLSGSGRYQRIELARNYRYMAESLLQTALEKDDLDHWAYPVLFAYRHTLELYLKTIGEIDETTHSLKRCVHLVEKRYGRKIAQPIRQWVLELDQIDPGGTAFRYDENAIGSKPYTEQWFDLAHFKFAMNQVFQVIDRAVLNLDMSGKPAA